MRRRALTSRPAQRHSRTLITRLGDCAGSRAFPAGVTVLAGGRFVRVSDFNYAKARTLVAAAICGDLRADEGPDVYGNYGVLLSLGPQAPWWVDNASQFLDPFSTRQAEVGVKYERADSADGGPLQNAAAVLLSQGDSGSGYFCTSNLSTGEALRRAICALSRTGTRRTTALN